jgi:hypothetical protein
LVLVGKVLVLIRYGISIPFRSRSVGRS